MRAMTKKYKDKAIEFEKKGLFDQDLNEHRYDNALRIDEGYSYLPRKISEKIRRFLLIPAVKFFGKIYAFFAYGFRIKGRKNLRKIRKSGAISVCNHVHEIDTLLVKLALGGYRTYHTGSFYLLKKGWAGRIFKAGGFLPVGESVRDLENLQKTVGVLMKKKKIVNFYPEHALWFRYEKIRPFKTGAFRFAVKFNVPVLPVFIEFRQTRLRKAFGLQKKIVMHILPPVYATEGGSLKTRAESLRDSAFEAMREKYVAVYGKEMVYLTETAAETGSEEETTVQTA